MASKKKQNKISAVIYIIAVILLLVALVGIIVTFTRNDKPPVEDGRLIVSINGQPVESGSSVGVLANGTEITIEGVMEFDVAVYVYGTSENDFSFTVGGEEYTWSGINNRNVTKGFTIEQTESGIKISYASIRHIISVLQNGAEVTVGHLPETDIFRFTVTAGNDYSDIYFRPQYVLDLDKTEIIL